MDHSELRAEAKLAVRAYAKDSSERNAVNAELAWERLREHNSSAIWRRMKDRWLEQDTATQSKKSKSGQAQGKKNGEELELLAGA